MANLSRLQAIETLRGGVSESASIKWIRDLATLAFDDPVRGREFSREVYMQRQAAGLEEW